MKYLLVFLIIVLPAIAFAQPDMSLLGIKIGEPLSLPDCNRHELRNTKQMCAFTDEPTQKAWGSSDIAIFVPSDNTHNFMRYGSLGVSILNGNVESVAFSTNGASVQDEVFQMLKEKYGRPTHFRKIPVQNAFGAKYVSYEAEWVFPDLRVTFSGISSDINWGVVEASTRKFEKIMKDWKDQSAARKPKL